MHRYFPRRVRPRCPLSRARKKTVVFGAMTQIALMLVPVDNRVPMRIAVGLFTVAFIFCIAIIAIFDAPSEFVLADEPATSLA